MILAACRQQKVTNYTLCHYPISVRAPKYTPSVTAFLQNWYLYVNTSSTLSRVHPLPKITICNHPADFMRHDPDFVKGLYLGVDLPLRYVIPCVILGVVNIRLVLAVRRAHIQHTEITGAARVSLFKLPILRTVATVGFVFLVCHAGGSVIFIMDIAHTFTSRTTMGKFWHGKTNILLDATVHTRVLIFKHLGFLLASVNSTLNVFVYCVFLPVFRFHWRGLCWPGTSKDTSNQRKDETPADVVPREEMQLAEEYDADRDTGKVVSLLLLIECRIVYYKTSRR